MKERTKVIWTTVALIVIYAISGFIIAETLWSLSRLR